MKSQQQAATAIHMVLVDIATNAYVIPRKPSVR
jgi:hypothetical protein